MQIPSTTGSSAGANPRKDEIYRFALLGSVWEVAVFPPIAYIEGYEIGGKTATSQTLPRSANKYISSFIGFAPADDPQILGMVIIHDPQGVYYGGTIAAPVLRDIYDNVLPYLGIEKK